MNRIAPYYKAVSAALIAFLSAIAAALAQDGISSQEWITAAIAFIVGLGAVFAIPNKPLNEQGETDG
jgi:ABC-type Na+ efflux pump permease subunit